jgi:hypothetical protein
MGDAICLVANMTPVPSGSTTPTKSGPLQSNIYQQPKEASALSYTQLANYQELHILL